MERPVYALTVWQPWATLIIAGAKPWEFRGRPSPSNFTGRRIVIHAGARQIKRDEVRELILNIRAHKWHSTLLEDIAMPLLEKVAERGYTNALPLAAGLGTVTMGKPRRAADIFTAPPQDSDRIDQHKWAWPMLEPEPFEPVVPKRGAQGFWPWA